MKKQDKEQLKIKYQKYYYLLMKEDSATLYSLMAIIPIFFRAALQYEIQEKQKKKIKKK